MAIKTLNNGKVYKTILVLPDMHMPFLNMKVLEDAYKWKKKHKPDLIIQIGDLFDQKAWSRWPKDPDDYSPYEEFEVAADQADIVAKKFPTMEVILGNHDRRIMHRAMEAGLTKHILRELNEVFDYPGWNWHMEARDRLIVNTPTGPVFFMHGDEMGGTARAKATVLGMSVCQGHTHQASVQYVHNEVAGHAIWAFVVGNMLDTASKGARYAAANPIGTVEGFGVIRNGVPFFIPQGCVL